jgi:hypothetical protein
MQTDRGVLDALGRAFLDFLDYRVGILVTLAVVVVCGLVNWRRTKKIPGLTPLLRACLGSLTVLTGVTVLCVFALTKPPYLDALSSDGLGVVGLVTFFSCLVFGVREVVALLNAVDKD